MAAMLKEFWPLSKVLQPWQNSRINKQLKRRQMKPTELEQALNDLRSLREMRDSRGWAILKATAKEDILNAALQLSENPTMTEKEVDFRRGSIAATRQFVNVVDLLIAKAENDILIATAEQSQNQNLNATA